MAMLVIRNMMANGNRPSMMSPISLNTPGCFSNR